MGHKSTTISFFFVPLCTIVLVLVSRKTPHSYPAQRLHACHILRSEQVLGHLGFDFEEGVPPQQEQGADGKASPTNKYNPSRGSSQFLSWGGTSAMSFEVGSHGLSCTIVFVWEPPGGDVEKVGGCP